MENYQNEKSKPLSVKQKETLIEYVHSRPEMYRGTFSATYTYATSVILWKQITDILNSIPRGSKKDWKQWRKTFVDMKKNIKSKHAKTKAHSRGTGGGPPLPPPKDEETDKGTEEKMLEIITPVALSGNFEVPEPEFNYDEINEDLDLENSARYSVLADHIYLLPENPQPGTSKETISEPLMAKITDISKENSKIQEKSKKLESSATKRMTKSERLTQSLRNNKNFLSISQSGISATETYRNQKLDILRTQIQNQENYNREKLEILKDISNAFNSIAQNLF